MKAQQAVAKPFVGRRVRFSTCLFFSFSLAYRPLAVPCAASLRWIPNAALPVPVGMGCSVSSVHMPCS
jgi:hypothetical protein